MLATTEVGEKTTGKYFSAKKLQSCPYSENYELAEKLVLECDKITQNLASL